MNSGLWGKCTGVARGHIILKGDSDNAVKAFKDAIGNLSRGCAIQESPPQEETQSNGRIEAAGKTIRGLVRVMKDKVETEAGNKFEGQINLAQWLVRWGAMVLFRFLVGEDGKTASNECEADLVTYQRRTSGTTICIKDSR